MTLSNKLVDEIQAAQNALERSTSGELLLAARKRIWWAMGLPDPQDETYPIGVGHIRRTRLFIGCIEHVLPIWTSAYPEHLGPQIMLKIAAKVLDASISEEVAKNAGEEFWSELEAWQDDQKYEFEPQYVGYGSTRTVTAALYDVIFPDDETFENEADWDYDAWDWPPDFYASLPYKGKSPEEIARLRGYWQWYLEEAVPAAYTSVSE